MTHPNPFADCDLRWVRQFPNLDADSGDSGHGFRLNATMRSDRRRPPVPTKAAGVSLPAFGVGSDFLGCVKFGALRSDLSHAVSIECEAFSVRDEPAEDGVSANFRSAPGWS